MQIIVHAFVGLLAARGGAGPQATPEFRAFHDGLIDPLLRHLRLRPMHVA